MNDYRPVLHWIDDQRDRMCQLVTNWSEINSGTFNLHGLARLSEELQKEFRCLDAEMTEINLSPFTTVANDGKTIQTQLGTAISIRKRIAAPVQIFLGIHRDTVYAEDHAFQHVTKVADQTVQGPGVLDAKGGLCVMLIALQALERSGFAERIGWDVLINPDEEIGSPGSAGLLVEAAKRNKIGLVFEPALSDGMLVSERKGSGNFSAIIRGRSAHAGRDFALGRNAIHVAGALTVALNALNHHWPEVTVNVGKIDGGGPTNIVPGLAIVRFNVRVPNAEIQREVETSLLQIVDEHNQQDGISVELEGGFTAPPKVLNPATLSLLEKVSACGRDLGLSLNWRGSGGVSDGNKLAAAGLTVVDTLGPVGGGMHSSEEFVTIDSLTERAKLSALLLMKIGSGEISLHHL